MADITRDIGQVSPTNYVRQGVAKPSPLNLAADVINTGINLDRELAKRRLQDEAESLRTQYEVGSPAAIAVQEEAGAPPISEGDKRQVDALGKELSTATSAVDQGRMTFDTYRVRGERLLRMAISKRPGLAQEFRSIAAQYLGTDVVGASVDVLAAGEAALQKAAQASAKGGPDYTRQRNHLDAVGVPSGLMTDEQVAAAYTANFDAVRQHLVQQAENEAVTTAAGTQKAGQDLRRPGATAAFVGEVQTAKLETYREFSQAAAAISTGRVSPEQLSQIITNGNATLSGRVSNLRAAMAQGDVDPAIAEKEITGLTELQRQMVSLADGSLTNEARQNKIKGTLLYLQNVMMDNENVAVLAAATQTFGPEIMSQYVGPGGAFNKTAAIALGDTLNNTGRPITRASSAGTVASSVISSTLDRGGAKSNPEMIPKMGQTLINAGTSFAQLSPKEFKADYLTGPNGYITVLDRQTKGLAAALPDNQKLELAQSVALAASANRMALVTNFGQKYPGLVGKVDFSFNPADGSIIRAKGAVTTAESSAIRQYNEAFAGKKVGNIIKGLTGADDFALAELIGTASQAAAAVPAPPTPAPKNAGGNWWEQL